MEYDKICYKKNYLTGVITRLDFLNPIDEIKSLLPKRLKNKIQKSFPFSDTKKQITQEIELNKADLILKTKEEKIEWLFFGQNRDKSLGISSESIWIKYETYINFEGAKKEIIDILSVLFSNYKDLQIKRYGLRYINSIGLSGNPFDWEGIISGNLLSSFNFYDKNALTRAFQVLEYHFDDLELKFQFGIANPDFPAVLRKRQFILDYDAYVKGVLDKGDVYKNLDMFHNKIQEFFEVSIGDKLRAILNE